MARNYRIAVIGGDGIGPEVTREALHISQWLRPFCQAFGQAVTLKTLISPRRRTVLRVHLLEVFSFNPAQIQNEVSARPKSNLEGLCTLPFGSSALPFSFSL